MTQEHGEDEWRELDDTLADGPAPAEVPEEARDWLADQRAMHGLLRALHTADAAAREDRVATVLARVDAASAAPPRRHWFAVAAAAMVLATLGVWFALPESLPTAEAAIQRAADELAREVDRRFRVRVTAADRGGQGERLRHEFEVVARPGTRFLIEGDLSLSARRVTDGTVGCDGETIWVRSADDEIRRSGLLAKRPRVLRGLDDLLADGYLDVRTLVSKLRGDFRLRTLERFVDERGEAVLRIEAARRGRRAGLKVRSAELLVDERTGMVHQLEAEVMAWGIRRQVFIEHLGEAAPGTVDYSRPW